MARTLLSAKTSPCHWTAKSDYTFRRFAVPAVVVFFAFGRGGFYGEPLSRDKAEMRESGDFEFDVFGEFRERGRTENAGLEIFELGHFSI